MPLLLSVPRNAVSPVIESNDASWIGSPAAISTHPNSSDAQSTAPPVADVPPVPPVSPPPSSLQAAATSVSAPRSARIARYLRFFIQPPSEGVLRSWSYANTCEERRFAPFLPSVGVVTTTFRRSRATRPFPRVPEDVRNRKHARTARRDPIRPVPPIGTRGRAPGRTPCRRRATDGRARSPPPRRRRTSTPRLRARARRSPPPPGAGGT